LECAGSHWTGHFVERKIAGLGSLDVRFVEKARLMVKPGAGAIKALIRLPQSGYGAILPAG
jgi:hypothetical protein